LKIQRGTVQCRNSWFVFEESPMGLVPAFPQKRFSVREKEMNRGIPVEFFGFDIQAYRQALAQRTML